MKKLVEDSEQVLSRYTSLNRDEMIVMMDEALENLTPEERETARFEIDEYSYPYDSNVYFALFVKWKRLETNEEEQKRKDSAAARELAELENYKRLKKKFG